MRPWSDALAWWLLDYYALATVLLAASIAIMGFLKQPAIRLLVARSSIVGLALLAVLAAFPGWPRASWRAQDARPQEARSLAPSAPAQDIENAPPHRLASMEIGGDRSSHLAGSSSASAFPQQERASRTMRGVSLEKQRPFDWSGLAAGLFLASASTILVWLALGHWRLRLLQRRSWPAPQWSSDVLARTVGDGRPAPILLISGFLDQPVTFGLSRPNIVLPRRFVEDEPRHRLEAALAHEWAHIRNRDLWWLALARLLLPALFVHPLYVWLRRRCRDDQELLADALAARGRIDYAEALLAWARCAPDRPRYAVAGSLALWERTSQLKRRVLVLLDRDFQVAPSCPKRLRLWVRGATACAVLALSFLTLRPPAVVADPPKPPEARQDVTKTEAPASVGKPAAEVRDVPITGRIIDLEGRPIPGITVQVVSTSKARNGDLGPWLEAVRRGAPPWVAFNHLENDEAKPSAKARTNAQGRFRLEGLGGEKVATLSIEGPTVAFTHIKVVTRRIGPFPAHGFSNDYGPGTETIYGADLTLSAAPGRVVEGVIRDAKGKKVMKDVDVWSNSFAGSRTGGMMTLKTRTDAEGRFRLAGLPKGDGNELLIVPNDDQPYFMQVFRVPNPPGLGAISFEVELNRGIWIEGRVTDKKTGEPAAGAWLHYLPFLDNTFAQAAPDFRGGVHMAGSSYQDRYQSRADGSFRLVGLPGRAIVGVGVHNGKPYRRGAGSESIQEMDEHGHFATFNNPVKAGRFFPITMREIHAAEGTETVHLDLELDPGAKVHLRVVDQEGKPISGVMAGGRRGRGDYDRGPQDQAEFDVVTLGPGEDRMVALVHEGRELGRVIHVKEGDDKNGPVVVALEPTATIAGRVVDPDGGPVSGATIRPILKPSGDYSLRLPEVVSGADGRFTVPNVPTGCHYSLAVESRVSGQQRIAFKKDLAVRPGETTDVGDIQFKE